MRVKTESRGFSVNGQMLVGRSAVVGHCARGFSSAQLAFAKTAVPKLFPKPFAAPELDPRLAIEGLVVAVGCTMLWWKRFRLRQRHVAS